MSNYFGVDISKFNTQIDYKKLAKEVDFAIIRVGYRGWGSGTLVKDELFETHMQGCIKNNIPVSVYWFAQEINEMEAIAAAKFVHNIIKAYKISLPIFYDSEMSTADKDKGEIGRADELSKNSRTSIVTSFCKQIENLGYKAGVYASESWFKDNLRFDSIKNYHIWVAKYGANKPNLSIYDMWQNSEKGKVNGIDGYVDTNHLYKDIFIKEKTSSTKKKSVEEVAKEVLDGKWGNGEDRKKKLINAGYDYKAIQNKVNSLTINSKTYKSSIGKEYRLKKLTTLYEKGNLTGKRYIYLKNTTVKVIGHYSTKIDKVKVIKTGRVVYCKVSAFI